MAEPTNARLACGCSVVFRPGVEGSPVTVVVDRKGDGCQVPFHVAGLAMYDHREALRPPTRMTPPEQTDYEEN